jgi:hypothetical protein
MKARRERCMQFEELVALVRPEWRQDLNRFVETGDAKAEFLEFLDRDT